MSSIARTGTAECATATEGDGTDGGETFTQRKVAEIRQIPAPIPPQGTAANDGLNSFRTGTVPTIDVTSDGIVHLAARTSVLASIRHPRELTFTTLAGTRRISSLRREDLDALYAEFLRKSV